MNLPHCSSSHGVLNSKRFSRSCHLNRFAMTATILIIQSPSRIECLLHTTSSCFAKLKGLIIEPALGKFGVSGSRGVEFCCSESLYTSGFWALRIPNFVYFILRKPETPG
ncbi:hypothetical protein SUGI_1156410 [Cryptomeria japonica]|nr:hypothetical protein SUGI_1156410 [Cryptomeria japonica]